MRLTIGCSAHIGNLLAHDVSKIITGTNSTQQRILQVIKYFRNHHLPKSWLNEAGGTIMEMPIEVRWNSFCSTFKSYLRNWPLLIQISDQHRSEMDCDVILYIQSVSLKRNVEELVPVMEPIAIAIDKLQKSVCNIAESVFIWKKLKVELWDCPNFNLLCKNCFDQRYLMAL